MSNLFHYEDFLVLEAACPLWQRNRVRQKSKWDEVYVARVSSVGPIMDLGVKNNQKRIFLNKKYELIYLPNSSVGYSDYDHWKLLPCEL